MSKQKRGSATLFSMKYTRWLPITFCLFLFLVSCTSTQKTVENQKKKVNYSLVYIIHGDANYTYHLNGEKRKAEIDALNRAIETGRNAKNGEVFIFHQKPEDKILFMIPKKDRLFYHFRHGELVGGDSYSPSGGGLAAEAKIYNKNHNQATNRNIFLYFGHEIPAGTPNLVYHQSQPYQRFNTKIFSSNLREFNEYFELTILSTCNNGNPVMIDELTGLTDYLIASPQNLHLSHLTDKPLRQLETNPEISTAELANSVATQSFRRLSGYLQTMVTVAVYDLSEMNLAIHAAADSYRKRLQSIQQNTLFVENVDCQSIQEIRNTLPSEGIILYFKPPAFGRNSSDNNHSGWGCKR